MTKPDSSLSRAAVTHRGRRRSGAVLVVALVCLLIVTAMIGTMLERAVSARRQLRVERDRRQAELLLQAGADRAALQLVRQSGYRGETWTTSREAMTGRGEVTIEVLGQSETAPRRVHIVAEYPLGSQRSILRSQTLMIPSSTRTLEE